MKKWPHVDFNFRYLFVHLNCQAENIVLEEYISPAISRYKIGLVMLFIAFCVLEIEKKYNFAFFSIWLYYVNTENGLYFFYNIAQII